MPKFPFLSQTSEVFRSTSRWYFYDFVLGGLLCFGLFQGFRYAYGQLLLIRSLTQIRDPDNNPRSTGGRFDGDNFRFAAVSRPRHSATETIESSFQFPGYGRDTEDEISEATLAELSFSPNMDMSDSARRLVVERVARSPGTWELLLSNIVGHGGPELQERGLIALKLFYQRSPLPQRDRTLRAIGKFLTKKLPEVAKRRHLPDTDWKERSQGERDALFVLRCEAEGNLEMLLTQAPMVVKWLSMYPYGGMEADQNRKRQVVQRLIRGLTDDESLGHILHIVYYDKNVRGRQMLRAAGLIGSAIHEGGMNTTSVSSDRQTVDRFTFFAPPETPGDHEGEDTEARLRRRRRNTVVAEPSSDDQNGTIDEILYEDRRELDQRGG